MLIGNHPDDARPRRILAIRRSKRGMALLEALVSILIVSFGILGLMGLEASAIHFAEDAENRTRASLLANDIASTLLLSTTITQGIAQNLANWQAALANQQKLGLPNATLTVTPVAGTTNSADVVITWRPHTDPSTSQPRRLTTRVTQP